jgi:NAD(P)-dependent dehydrogenase (short-subunit alcohol dehydrogenase family)
VQNLDQAVRREILLTGATGRIGSVLTGYFASRGNRVICTYRNSSAWDKFVEPLAPSVVSNVVGIEADLSSIEAPEEIVRRLEKKGLRPTAFISAARDRSSAVFDEFGVPSRETWLNEYRMNVIVPFELSLALATSNRSQLKSIVVLASMYGVVAINPELQGLAGERWPIHYGCAKAASIQMVKELAIRLAKGDIRVNAISYAGVEGRADDAFIGRYERMCPQGRMLNDRDLPGAVEFLISESASGVTGTNLMVDGGWTAW